MVGKVTEEEEALVVAKVSGRVEVVPGQRDVGGWELELEGMGEESEDSPAARRDRVG